MMTRLIKTLLFSMLLIGCAANADHSKEIIANLKSEGRSYYNQLILNQKYDDILDKIESGDATLIRGAYLLLPWVDAATSTSLKYSLSRALTKKPDAVMSLVPKYFSVTDICTIPYIEESIKVELNHINLSIRALEHALNGDHPIHYSECLDIYKKLKKNIIKSSNGR